MLVIKLVLKRSNQSADPSDYVLFAGVMAIECKLPLSQYWECLFTRLSAQGTNGQARDRQGKGEGGGGGGGIVKQRTVMRGSMDAVLLSPNFCW